MPQYTILYTATEYREVTITAASENLARKEFLAHAPLGAFEYSRGDDTDDPQVIIDIWEA